MPPALNFGPSGLKRKTNSRLCHRGRQRWSSRFITY